MPLSLAVAWARPEARVAALDIDPQGSLAAWVAKPPVRVRRQPK